MLGLDYCWLTPLPLARKKRAIGSKIRGDLFAGVTETVLMNGIIAATMTPTPPIRMRAPHMSKSLYDFY